MDLRPTAKIKEMRSLKPPRPDDYPHVQRNLHKLKLHLQYMEEQGESSRLEASVVHEIVNTSLDSDLLKQYNKEFMDFRTKQKKNRKLPSQVSLYISTVINYKLRD